MIKTGQLNRPGSILFETHSSYLQKDMNHLVFNGLPKINGDMAKVTNVVNKVKRMLLFI